MAVSLLSTASVEEQWREVAGPWLRAHAMAAWKNRRPTVILTPSRAESFYLRGRLVSEGVSYLGLRFWTPSDARTFLHEALRSESGPATQAELRLLARHCAERRVGAEGAGNASLASVVRDPGAFLRGYDLLLSAGWDPARDGAVYGRDLAGDFQVAMERSRVATQAGLHLELRRSATARHDALMGDLLVAGFNATHWPLWDLLQAVVRAAGNVTVALSLPRGFGETLDQLWISSWEEAVAGEGVIPSGEREAKDVPAPFAPLAQAYEDGTVPLRVTAGKAELTLLATPSLASQIQAVVLQTLVYVRSETCTRLGIVFPEANALAQGVAAELGRLKIPLDDGTGSLMPGAFEQRHWQSWLALQEEPGGPRLIAWLRACEAEGVSCGTQAKLSARDMAESLERALSATLIDDLDFLALHLVEAFRHERATALAEFLRERIALPNEAPFKHFLKLTRQMLEMKGWEDQGEQLQIDPPAWMLEPNLMVSRRAFLEWLRDATESRIRSRGPQANHFYGKVHLVIYGQMTGQTWSHLILTGLNEGVWPRLQEAGAFGSRHELAMLNQRMRELNPHGTIEGRHGAGQETVAMDHGHCLLPQERRDLALRDLCAALESTQVAVTLSTLTAEGGRSLLPSDFFGFAYQASTGEILDDDAFRTLASATRTWCQRHEGDLAAAARTTRQDALDDLPLFSNPGVDATRVAYAARRDATQPFGRYEFAYAEPPAQPIQLTCKQWETAWKHPASVWLGQVVGAATWPDGLASWSNAIGMWVHRWLKEALHEWREKTRSAAELPVLVWAAADREAGAIRARARLTGVALYPWWEQVWESARTRALQVSETLAPLLPLHDYAAEFELPPGLMVALPNATKVDFRLRGRIDFVCITSEENAVRPGATRFAGATCQVIDFKTGASTALTERNVLKGTGLQALLYALAVQEMGAAEVSFALLTASAPLKTPLPLSRAYDPLLASLDILHRQGIFGMRPDAESEYGYAPGYPLATQFVSSAILNRKWALTHRSSDDGKEADAD